MMADADEIEVRAPSSGEAALAWREAEAVAGAEADVEADEVAGEADGADEAGADRPTTTAAANTGSRKGLVRARPARRLENISAELHMVTRRSTLSTWPYRAALAHWCPHSGRITPGRVCAGKTSV